MKRVGVWGGIYIMGDRDSAVSGAKTEGGWRIFAVNVLGGGCSLCLEMLRCWALFSSRDAVKSLRNSGEDPLKETA
jgi:hypothetical protein